MTGAKSNNTAGDARLSEDSSRTVASPLRERLKELDCLYGISHIVEWAGGSLDTILQETANLLPPSWEHPDISCARIVVDEREFRTANWVASPWRQTAEIFIRGKPAGRVEVCYLEEQPERDEGPFLAEERRLIDSIAERLGHTAERIRADQDLQEQQDELRERLTHISRVSTMGEMASSLAHEVNQPLTAIATYAQACWRLVDAEDTNSEQVLDVLQRIGEEALRAGDMIHRLRALVQRRGGEKVECAINTLIRSVEPLAEVDARLRDVELRLHLGRSLPAIVADCVQIQQVLLNLIRNGVDACADTEHRQRAVVVRTVARTPAEIEISVSDNGCGLSADAEEKLFQPFFTTKEKGIGVGLSICHSIVDAHGGRVWYSRNPEGGTTFYFTIPTVMADVSDDE